MICSWTPPCAQALDNTVTESTLLPVANLGTAYSIPQFLEALSSADSLGGIGELSSLSPNLRIFVLTSKNAKTACAGRVTLVFMMTKPLNAKVALVAGSTRGAGRGIACMLGEAGATVFCTERSVRGHLSTKGRPETIDDTARMVNEYGGEGIAVQVDHTVPEQVRGLFERVASEKGRLDILVNNVNGDDLYEWKPFWELSLENGFRSVERGV